MSYINHNEKAMPSRRLLLDVAGIGPINFLLECANNFPTEVLPFLVPRLRVFSLTRA